jgi:ABC-type multidrug transport system ATPase subunit
MEEADELCDRVAFIKHGKIVVIDTPQNLKLRYGRPTVKVTFVNQQTVVLPLSDRIFLSQMLAQFDNQKVQTIHSEEASLEDVFIQLVGKDSDQ